MTGTLEDRVRQALAEVLDPCSIGRGVPAGMIEMGMVTDLRVRTSDGRTEVDLTVRLTSPGCTFQLYFDQQIRARIEPIEGIDRLDVRWSHDFDWSDDDMSAALKQRLREKRSRMLQLART